MFKTIDPEISDNNEPVTGGRRPKNPNKAGKVPNVSKLKGDPEDEDEGDDEV